MRWYLVCGFALMALVTACRDSKTFGVFDAGGQGADASPLPMIDAGPPADANFSPSGRIDAARAASDGPVDITIAEATVTYLHPGAGQEGPGFFIQADAEGPGLFVAIDPATLEPVPAVGDAVSFTITEMGSANGGLRQVVTLEEWARISTGNSVEDFYQNVSGAADLVTSLAAYDSELIEIEGTIAGAFGFGGAGHRRASIVTEVLPEGSMIALRIPEALETELLLSPGCTFKLRGVMWRFGGTAQPSGYRAEEFSEITCGRPKVVSAIAASATSVIVEFDRPIDPASVDSPATQFAIAPTLAVSAASTSGSRVTLTTAAQTPAQAYTLTVDDSVLDIAGEAVDEMANTAMFAGYEQAATLVINEFSLNIPFACDLIEIRALTGGSIGGFELYERSDLEFVFPAMNVVAGDIIVVHTGSPVNCNNTGAINETTSPSAQPASAHPQNYDTAFDLYVGSGGFAATNNVVSLEDPTGTIVDAVLASNGNNDVAGSSESRAAVVAAAGQWTTQAGGVPPGGFVDADFVAHAVGGLGDPSTTTPGGSSLQRIDDSDDDDSSDWTVTPATSTYGARNVGQNTP